MRINHRLTAAAVALVVGAGIVTMPVAARASEEGRRNTALALGAAAGYLLMTQRDKTAGIAAAAGAAYAYKRYDDSVKDRHNRERYGYYDRYNNDRYDSRYDNRYDNQYDNRYDRNRNSRYDNERYNDNRDNRDSRYNDRYDSGQYNDRYYDRGNSRSHRR